MSSGESRGVSVTLSEESWREVARIVRAGCLLVGGQWPAWAETVESAIEEGINGSRERAFTLPHLPLDDLNETWDQEWRYPYDTFPSPDPDCQCQGRGCGDCL